MSYAIAATPPTRLEGRGVTHVVKIREVLGAVVELLAQRVGVHARLAQFDQVFRSIGFGDHLPPVVQGLVRLRGASRFGPNGLKFDKETTHGLVRWTRVASTA